MVYHKGLINDLCRREYDSNYNEKFRSSNVYNEHFINRLTFASELKGHDGCVNCIEWNQEGNLLISGSDDRKIMLWNVYKGKCINKLDTLHHGNIFSVKFLPLCNDSVVISAAADHKVFVHDMHTKSVIHELKSHHNRVKRLAVASDTPHLFWSCGEDGFIMQHDIRCSTNEATSILINYTSCAIDGNSNTFNDVLEVKCIDINPIKTELLAVGCNDPFLRLYDRRMITTQKCNSRGRALSDSKSCCVHEICCDNDLDKFVQYYVPGHIPPKQIEYKKRLKHVSITYVSFNTQDSNELLVNLSGEQIYLFDINDKYRTQRFKFDAYKTIFSDLVSKSDEDSKKQKSKLPFKTEILKTKANDSFENGNYFEAINYYNKAIERTSDSAILYGNLAAALLKRRWNGDLYEAMRDCYEALYCNKDHLKSHFRLSRCLHDLKYHKEAKECLDIFCKLYPDYASSHTCVNVIEDIEKVLIKLSKSEETNKRKAEKMSKDEQQDESKQSQNEENRKCKINEKYLQENFIDYKKRFVGHCNVATDIKEANFIGSDFIGAGSDDGSFYIWNRHTTNLVRILKADESILNCVQPNKHMCLIATSGIDSEIRLWSPSNIIDYNQDKDERVVDNLKDVVEANQKQMNANPMDFLFMNLNNARDILAGDDDETAQDQPITCRTS